MKLQTFILLFILFSLLSCNKSVQKITELKFEKDLIPEGIAIDTKTEKVYLNSLKNNNIVSSQLDGSSPNIFIKSSQYNYQSGFGMTIKGDTLYALGNGLQQENNISILLLLNIKTGALIDTYKMQDLAQTFWNDLTISEDNTIYITESQSNKIYKIQRPNKTVEVFLDTEEIPHSNGITISEDNQHLYFGSSKGIRIVDIKTKKILNEANEDFLGIDGLKSYKNSLIGNINVWDDESGKNGFYRFYLDEAGTNILSREKIIPHGADFKVPTTFDILNNHIYFIINTQLDNFDEVTNEIKNEKELEAYQLMKFPIGKKR